MSKACDQIFGILFSGHRSSVRLELMSKIFLRTRARQKGLPS